MNALEAAKRLVTLNERIEALEVAHEKLWSNFDDRNYAIVIGRMIDELKQEQSNLVEKLESMQI
jgi:hypothetical protein